MILGVDIGNFATKDNLGNKFESKVSYIPNAMGDSKVFELDGETFFINKGEFDTTFRKIEKENYFKLLYASLCSVNKIPENYIKLVVGLPLSQFKNDKNSLREKILNKGILDGSFNDERRVFIFEDCRVYMEGIASMPINYEGIFVDIGGRTTDAGYTYIENGKRKVDNPYSLPVGSINLYSDFIKVLNFKYGLDLKVRRAEDIITKGLFIEDKKIDLTNEMNIFKNYLDSLVSDLNVQYSLKTNHITFTGGGSLLFNKSIQRRIKHAKFSDNAVFGNANGFYQYGRSVWSEDSCKF